MTEQTADDALVEVRLVPVEPTDAMIDAFVSCALRYSIHGEGGGWSRYARVQWKQMLDAAPRLDAIAARQHRKETAGE